MYLHISGDTVVRSKDIVAILSSNVKLPNWKIDAQNEVKSIVITKDRIYFSPISTFTLKKRSESLK